MHADVKGVLKNLNKYYHCFEHNGEKMTKAQVRAVLEYGKNKGYNNTGQISDDEVDMVLKQLKQAAEVVV